MRQNGAGAGIGVAGLVGLLAVSGCASAGGGAVTTVGQLSKDPRVAEAQAAIARRIATTVDAIERKDVDALLAGATVEWTDRDGRPLSKDEARAVVLREWAPVERTIELTVQLDSLRLVSDDAALVYTSQLWQRIVVARDGGRHDVVTTTSIAQAWGRSAGKWRGTGPARMFRATTLVDGKETPNLEAVLASRTQ